MSMLPIFYVQTGTIFDWDGVVNALAENSRKVVLKNNMDGNRYA